MLDGRWADAQRMTEAVADAQVALVQRLQYAAQLGGLEQVDPEVRAAVEEFPAVPAWRAALAFVVSESGKLDAAREQLELLAEHDFDDVPFDGHWIATLNLCGWVADRLRHERAAELLFERLRPYAGVGAVNGAGAATQGPVALTLVRLALLTGRDAEVDALLARARNWCESMRSPVWTATVERQARALER